VVVVTSTTAASEERHDYRDRLLRVVGDHVVQAIAGS
jgi:hypothetical protein